FSVSDGELMSATAYVVIVVSDEHPPSTPTNLEASSIQSTHVTIRWDAASDNVGVIGYKVSRDDELVATTASVNYTDSSLEAARLYEYQVLAYDAAGNVSSASEALRVTTIPTEVDNPPQIIAQEIPLKEGWNLVSTYVNLSDTDLDQVLDS